MQNVNPKPALKCHAVISTFADVCQQLFWSGRVLGAATQYAPLQHKYISSTARHRTSIQQLHINMKKGKTAGLDNITAELVQAGEKPRSTLSPSCAIKSGRVVSGPHHGPSHSSSHFRKKAICNCAKTTAPSVLSAISAKSF